MGVIVDGFSHVLPKPFAEKLLQVHPTKELKELASFPYFGDIGERLRVLDKYGIDKQVLTLARPSIWLNMPQEFLLELTRVANDSIAQIAHRHPDRFIPVATLPVPDEAALEEFDRCMGELGMKGIQIFGNINGRPLDNPEFRPFFEKASKTRTPIWLHPQLWQSWPIDFVLDKMFGWLFDTSVAMGRLVFSGIMEAFPGLRIITHHMGAMVPHFSERIRGFYEAGIFPRVKFATLSKDPLEYFRRFYGDTVLNGSVHAFECGYRFFGADRIVFATDYPFGPGRGEAWLKGALEQVRNSDVLESKEDKEKIMGCNLMELVGK